MNKYYMKQWNHHLNLNSRHRKAAHVGSECNRHKMDAVNTNKGSCAVCIVCKHQLRLYKITNAMAMNKC